MNEENSTDQGPEPTTKMPEQRWVAAVVNRVVTQATEAIQNQPQGFTPYEILRLPALPTEAELLAFMPGEIPNQAFHAILQKRAVAQKQARRRQLPRWLCPVCWALDDVTLLLQLYRDLQRRCA